MNHRWARLVLVVSFAGTSLAQSVAGDAETIQELRRQITSMSDRLREMERTLAELEGRSNSPEATGPAKEKNANRIDESNRDVPTTVSRKGAAIGDKVAKYETAGENQAPAPRPDNMPLDPTYAGFFRLPTTTTWLKIGGYVKADLLYDPRPAGNTDAFIPSSIPVGTVADVANANLHMRQSRFNFDFRTPFDQNTARTFIEFDFFGSTGPTTTRLRHLYGQFRNVLAGLTFSNFADPDAAPDTLDFAGSNGAADIKNAQLRYSVVLSKRSTMSLSAEKPVSDVLSARPNITIVPRSPAPDLSARWRFEDNRGHVQVASIFRWLEATDSEFRSATAFGWGLSLAASLLTTGRDNVVLQTSFGRGIGRYIVDISGQGADAAFDSPVNPVAKALPTRGVAVGYQHYWTRFLRSNAIFGYAAVENTPLQPSDVYHQSQYFAANIIWNPLRHVHLGAEALYGWQELKNGTRGNATRIQLSTKYRFLNRDE